MSAFFPASALNPVPKHLARGMDGWISNHHHQVLYEKTGRKGLVVSAVIAFVALSWGLWLFTLITPAFYWFGVPTTFVVFYTASHCA